MKAVKTATKREKQGKAWFSGGHVGQDAQQAKRLRGARPASRNHKEMFKMALKADTGGGDTKRAYQGKGR